MPRSPRKSLTATSSLPGRLLLLYRLVALTILGVILIWAVLLPRPSRRNKVARTPTSVARNPLRHVTVILDPGHGGLDSGYRRSDCREDELNYRFTATLATVLRAAGAQVILTVKSAALEVPLMEGKPEPPLVTPRDAVLVFNQQPVYGTVNCLHQRAAIVREPFLALSPEQRSSAKGLYFLAIHHDDYFRHRIRGGHVLFDKRSGGPPKFAHILARRLSEANLTRQHYEGQLPASDARQLGVLNPLYNPVPQRVLIEIATISNPKDRDIARSRQWRWRVAYLIRDAIIESEK